MKFYKTLTSQLFILLVGLALVSCQWSERTSTSLSVGFGGGQKVSFSKSQMISKAAIDEVYPTLSTILLSVSTPTLNTRQINNQYNGSRLSLNAAGTAIVLTDTVVELVVPNSELLTIEIQAINLEGYKVFSGEIELSPLQLAEPSVAVAVPLEVDVDTSIPILASLSGCSDADADDLCDVYEDLFLNSSGVADIDGDGLLNKNDTDSDGDSVPDDQDRNASVTVGSGPTPSNNGYPMFIVANREPVINDVTITTSENQSFTLSLPVAQVDADVNDDVTYFAVVEPANGSVVISGTDIIYAPNGFFLGTDSFTIQASDIASSYTEGFVDFTVTVNVLDNASINNTTPIAVDDGLFESTPGAAVRIPALANDSDPDIDAGIADTIRIESVTSDKGHVFVMPDNEQIYFWSDRTDTGIATITYTIADNLGAQATAQVEVNLDNIDADGDGLVPGAGTHSSPINGTVNPDPDDASDDSDLDGFSDWHAEFNADKAGTTLSTAITENTVLTIAGSPYFVPDNVLLTVSNDAHLVIEQGVVLKFGSNASLNILSGGQLSVLGGDTYSLAVIFTSDDDLSFQSADFGVQFKEDDPNTVDPETLFDIPVPGHWYGIGLDSAKDSLIGNSAVYFSRNAISISDGDHKVVSSIFSNSLSAGVLVSTQSASTFFGNNFSHNAVGFYAREAADGLTITDSFIVENDGGTSLGYGAGLSVDSGITGELTIENAFVYNNIAQNSGGGMWIGDGSKVSVFGSTFYNNGTNNMFGDQNGIILDSSVSDQGLITIRDTLFEGNTGETTDDVSLTATAIANSVDLATVVSSLTDFNWTDLGVGGSGLPDGIDNLFGNFTSAVETDSGGYLQSASPARDAGSVLDFNELEYLVAIETPTADISGTVDTQSGDQLDIGFHHKRAQFSVSANDSSVLPSTFSINELQWTSLVINPKGSGGAETDSFNQISTYLNPFNGSVVIQNERYLPGGRYAYEVSLSTWQCTSADFGVLINNVQSAVSSASLNSSNGC